MHERVFGLGATIVLRDEFLSLKVLRDAKSMGTADLNIFILVIQMQNV
jgi:hypothetical protein